MTLILADYLSVILPFRISFHGENTCIMVDKDHSCPLFVKDAQMDPFIQGFSMLNYCIVYLCATQACDIELERTGETLDNLAQLCQSDRLGKYFFLI